MIRQREFDLSGGYNRIADIWYPVYVSRRASTMPITACAYPIDMGERMIADIRDEVLPEDHHLRWQIGLVQLHCHWQGRAWQRDGALLVFIENAVGWADPVRLAEGGHVDVHVAFGHPRFADNVAAMVVDFRVDERDARGTVARDVHRPFRIHADGRRDRLF